MCIALTRSWYLLPLLFAAACAQRYSPSDVLTRSYDNVRSGHASYETILTPANVGGLRYLGSLDVDGDVFAQPLYVKALDRGSAGVRDVVFIATNHNTVFAFDAATATPLWSTNLGPSVPRTVFDPGCDDSAPFEFGITSTPAINLLRGVLYAVAKLAEPTASGVTFRQRLVVLDLVTGAVVNEADIAGSYTMHDRLGRPVTSTFHPKMQLNRAGLLVAGGNLYGNVYVAFGPHCDGGDYHGWVFAHDVTNVQRQNGVFVTTPMTALTGKGPYDGQGQGGGIWMAGQGLAADAAGNVYFSTGNPMPRDLRSNTWDDKDRLALEWLTEIEPMLRVGVNVSDALVKLGPPPGPGALWRAADWFAPQQKDSIRMYQYDDDLGSAGVVLVPSATGNLWVVGGGKMHMLYVVRSEDMGQYRPYPPPAPIDSVVQSLDVHPDCPGVRCHLHGSPVYWDDGSPVIRMYVWGESDVVKGFAMHKNATTHPFDTKPFTTSLAAAPSNTMPGGVLSISSNGADPRSGIVWGIAPARKETWQAYTRLATLRAFDAQTLAEKWQSSQFHFAKFAPPTIADGRVYVATFDHRVDVYGLGLPFATQEEAVFGGLYEVEDTGRCGPSDPNCWRYTRSCEREANPAACRSERACKSANDAECSRGGEHRDTDRWYDNDSRPNPETGAFHCASAPYVIEDVASQPVRRWLSPRRIGRIKAPEGPMWGANQYACIGRIDPGYRYQPDWGGAYQIDDCGTNNVPNALASPRAFACPNGSPGRAFGRVKAPEGGMCGAWQFYCRTAPGAGYAFGGMFQKSDCDSRLDVGNPVRADGAAACPVGMVALQYGRIKEPEGGMCGANQYMCVRR